MDTMKLQKTQRKAYYRHGLCDPNAVYGESADEMVRMALTKYHRNYATIYQRLIKDAVDNEFIG